MTTLTLARLRSEAERCIYCEQKPCQTACPAHCSPADFIMAAAVQEDSDFKRAAALILAHNPMGATCGATCPETHCQAACSRMGYDVPIDIPPIQASLVKRAADLGLRPEFVVPEASGKKVAIIGAGPAGLVAAFTLVQSGHEVAIFDRMDRPGGACNLIPEERLPRDLLRCDLDFLLDSDRITLHLCTNVADPASLSDRFDAVLVAAGLTEPIPLGVPGEDAAIYGWHFLESPEDHPLSGGVAVIGGGAVACDCATIARLHGAERVEMIALEKLSEMPLAERERKDILERGVQVSGRTRVTAVRTENGDIVGLDTIRVTYPKGDMADGDELGGAFDVRSVVDVPGTEQVRPDFKHVIIAIGHRPSVKPADGMFIAGDCAHGASTVVEAVASGKNAAMAIHAKLTQGSFEAPHEPRKSTVSVPGYDARPVSLETDFFGRKIHSPFLLSAAPPTDGYEQMKLAYEAGWAGGIMKTAFDNIPIHIPAAYMFAFDGRTWGNCDNVSGHSLRRVCAEIERLVAEYPDRLTMGSTGGPVTGNDAADKLGWQSNTRLLEDAGAMGIEYSLSCPQGGDGTEGDIVSQSPVQTAKIIDWILETGDPEVPKLFKLTAAVTSIPVILLAIKEVLERYPKAKAGVTLANTFPTLAFRKAPGKKWEEGVVVGMSGLGVTPISNLSLANVSGLGVTVSGNGGPMDYKAAAHFLALGARTVQFCTLAMKYGYGIIDEMESGLSHLMAARGIASVDELIGYALPGPVTDFMDLTPIKRISEVDPELCVGCGNCTRCSYLALSFCDEGYPVADPERCVGCSICAEKCISGAIRMRERTPEELAALRED